MLQRNDSSAEVSGEPGKRSRWRAAPLAAASLAAALAAGALFYSASSASGAGEAPTTGTASTQPAATPAQIEFFQKTIKPLLTAKCYTCHGNGKHKGGLSMDTREDLLKGGKKGPVIVPGKPDDSLMIQAVSYKEKLKMPPPSKGQLTDQQVSDLTKWIADGAVWVEK